MATTLIVTPPADDRKLLAPVWHTVVLVLFVVSYSLIQVHFAARTETLQLRTRVPLYLFSIFFELVLLAYVWFLGVRRSGTRFADVIGGKWARAADVWRDIGVAFMFWLVVIVFLLIVGHALGQNPHAKKALLVMMPRGALEILLWVLLSISAGFCEEFIFRGYLQKQFFAITGMQRRGHRWASTRFRRRSWLPGCQRHDLNRDLRRAFRHSRHDAKKPASGNDSTLHARLIRGYRLEPDSEVPPRPTRVIFLKLNSYADFPAGATRYARPQLHFVAAEVFVVEILEPFAQFLAGAFF